jgi:hypothetical protein
MEPVQGGITENASMAPKGSPEWNAAQQQADLARSSVTSQTAADVVAFGNRLVQKGSFYNGEVQGLVDAKGRWRPIDFQSVEKLPPKTDAVAYQEAMRRHNNSIQAEADLYRGIAQQNAAKGQAP